MEIRTLKGYMPQGQIFRTIVDSGTITLNVPNVGEMVTLDGMSEKAYLILNVTLFLENSGMSGFATIVEIDPEDEEMSPKSDIIENVRFDRIELSDLI